ncbi:antibiotic biosynthesis monooxygenase [Pseudothauera nasutitermitis]|uniref:Antibiotic biosynthesis monooxygenase n=1 Tax=Pseudothauera nasutitermitis TaxID=2565930 RepID=A0A4V3WCI3_9RHOO|nr:antibiotic biosynthesis monooxygenase [Pseudothauera nasutitermitis]THF67314.1 antibiotic biosynthesis monooxygenase [Pseudothauera nasutitermitis]
MSTASPFAHTSEPPYYAVIFSSRRTEGDNGYESMAERMVALAAKQPGFLGAESARGVDGFGITVSYWTSPECIAAWKANVEHCAAQEMGKHAWYEHYEIRVAKVERAYGKPSV